MTRADFWCRVLGWIEILGSAAFAGFILLMWNLFLELFQLEDIPALSFLLWLFIFFAIVPMLLTGLFTVLFANAVEQARNGLREQGKVILRVLMALAGLWAAGVIGTAGLSVPAFGLAGIFALASTGLAIMGPDWTADLFQRKEPAS